MGLDRAEGAAGLIEVGLPDAQVFGDVLARDTEGDVVVPLVQEAQGVQPFVLQGQDVRESRGGHGVRPDIVAIGHAQPATSDARIAARRRSGSPITK